MADIGTLMASLGVDTSSLNGSKKHMTDFAREAEQRMGTATRSTNTLSSAFRTLGVAISGALVLRKMVQFGTEGVRAFGSLEQSIAKASTLFGEAAVDTDNLKQKIRDLSNSSGLAADAIGEGLYNALSAGVQATTDMTASMTFMEGATKLARAGFTDMETASSATIKTLNAYNLGLEETERIQRILIQTQNKGIVVVDELGKYLARVTPVAAQFGVSFENVGAAIATMTAQGLPARIAISQLSALLTELGKDGTEGAKALEVAAKEAGLATGNFSALMKSGMTLGEVLTVMEKSASKSGKSLINMFSSIEAGKASVMMTGESTQRMSEAFDSMSTDADVLGEAYAKVMDTLSSKTQIMSNKVMNLKGQVGEVLAPSISTIVDKFGDWVDRNQELIGQKMEEWAENLATAVGFVADNMDKLVFFAKGLVGLKIVTWLTGATTGMTLFAGATWTAVAAAKALGKALLIGFVIEGIELAITAFQKLSKIVADSPLTWRDAMVVSMDFFVNGIISTVVSLGNLMTNLMHLITDPIVYGLAQVFSFDTIKSVMSGNFIKAFADIGTASSDALKKAWAKIPADFNDTMSTRTFKIASDQQMEDFWAGYFGPAPVITPIVAPAAGGLIPINDDEGDSGPAAGFGPDANVVKSQMESLTKMYQKYQDDLTLMDYTGWEQRKKEVELWGQRMDEELTGAGVWNDEFKTLIENIMKTQGLILKAEEGAEDKVKYKKFVEYANDIVEASVTLEKEIEAMANGPEAFAKFKDGAMITAQMAEMKKKLLELGATAEWMDVNLPAYEAWLKKHREAQKEMDILATKTEEIKSITTNAFDTMFTNLIDNLFEGKLAWKDFGDVVMRVIQDIITQMMIMKLINPAASALGDALGGLFTKSAKGNVFDNSGITPFKRGGVVSKPTIFPFAKGTGLMGEAGPEAIMPLKRIGGDLGVLATGGGGGGNAEVIVNIINKGEPVEVEKQTQSKGPNGENILEIMVKKAIGSLDSKGALDPMFQRHGAYRGGNR